MLNIKKGVGFVALLIVGLGAVVSCSPETQRADTSSNAELEGVVSGTGASPAPIAGIEPSVLDEDAEIPSFEGPWANDFASAYRLSTSDLQRQVLADGAITEMEVAALQDSYRSCLETLGFSQIEFGPNGSGSFMPPDGLGANEALQLDDSCRTISTGPNGGMAVNLYWQMQRNPLNISESELMAQCLVRSGLVDQDYSAEDYLAESPDGYAFDVEDPRFGACALNPLTAGTS